MSGMQSNIGGIAERGINRAKLKTALGSASGTLATGVAVTISLDPYSFAPDLAIATTTAAVEPAGATPADAALPRYRIRNNDGVTRAYGAAWRYIES